jgi:hypothetical protein
MVLDQDDTGAVDVRHLGRAAHKDTPGASVHDIECGCGPQPETASNY